MDSVPDGHHLQVYPIKITRSCGLSLSFIIHIACRSLENDFKERLLSNYFERYRPRSLSEHVSGLHWHLKWAQSSHDRMLDPTAMHQLDLTLGQEAEHHEREFQNILARSGAHDGADFA